LRRPFLLLAILALLPHVLGSAVNITSNAVRIVNALAKPHLAGAVLMIGVGPAISGERALRLLIAALIVLGMCGFGVTTVVHHLLSQTLAVLMRADGAFTGSVRPDGRPEKSEPFP
jgi:hypothetical protein